MWSRAQRSWRRAILGHRRLLAFVLTTAAVLAGIRTVAPPAPPTVAVAVAARDLAAGSVLSPSDVTVRHVDPRSVPDGLVRRAVGRTLASGVRRGEPITDVRLAGARLGGHGLVAVPVRLPDAAMAALLLPGDHVDLYATDPSAGGTTLVAGHVLVLAVPDRASPDRSASLGADSDNVSPSDVTSAPGGRLVLVGVPPSTVSRVTDASVRLFLTVAFGD